MGSLKNIATWAITTETQRHGVIILSKRSDGVTKGDVEIKEIRRYY